MPNKIKEVDSKESDKKHFSEEELDSDDEKNEGSSEEEVGSEEDHKEEELENDQNLSEEEADSDDEDLSEEELDSQDEDNEEDLSDSNENKDEEDIDPSNKNEDFPDEEDEEPKKKTKGIIYLSDVPHLMSVEKLRQTLRAFGEVGRVYLVPKFKATSHIKKKRFVNIEYKEGWVEFLDKKVAKKVAALLNNQQVGLKRRASYYDSIWRMKYLHKFFWDDLSVNVSALKRAPRLQKEALKIKSEVEKIKSSLFQQKEGKRQSSNDGNDAPSKKTKFETPNTTLKNLKFNSLF